MTAHVAVITELVSVGPERPLGLHQRLNTGFRKIQQSIQLWTAERFPFCRALDLQQAPVTGDDDIEVHLGPAVLAVVQIQHWGAVHEADGDGGQLVADGVNRDQLTLQKDVAGPTQGEPGPCHRCCARSGIRLDHVAIHQQSTFPQRFHVDHGPQAAADQALNLLGPARQFHQLPPLPFRRGTREQAVFSAQPSLSLSLAPAGNAFLQRHTAQHGGAARAHDQ